MSKLLILVVEDDTPVRNLITTTLKAHDYRYLTAATGESAVMEAASHNPDIILLDLGLPDIDGVEVIHRIRSWSNVPILVISARSEDADKINALDAGAERRLALIQASPPQKAVYANGQLRIDYASGCAFLAGEELHLTPIEYKLLCLLAQNTGKVLTHKYINQSVWGSSWENDVVSLRVFMATLRKKLESAPGSTQYIQTHIGIGYRMLKIE